MCNTLCIRDGRLRAAELLTFVVCYRRNSLGDEGERRIFVCFNIIFWKEHANDYVGFFVFISLAIFRFVRRVCK